jgi:hypothetical protein
MYQPRATYGRYFRLEAGRGAAELAVERWQPSTIRILRQSIRICLVLSFASVPLAAATEKPAIRHVHLISLTNTTPSLDVAHDAGDTILVGIGRSS